MPESLSLLTLSLFYASRDSSYPLAEIWPLRMHSLSSTDDVTPELSNYMQMWMHSRASLLTHEPTNGCLIRRKNSKVIIIIINNCSIDAGSSWACLCVPCWTLRTEVAIVLLLDLFCLLCCFSFVSLLQTMQIALLKSLRWRSSQWLFYSIINNLFYSIPRSLSLTHSFSPSFFFVPFFSTTDRLIRCRKQEPTQMRPHVSALSLDSSFRSLIAPMFALALARTIQAKKRRPKNAGKPRPPRDLLQKKL